ncbi:MAG: hypothetical protein R3C20_14310 [Planctomycetaceae bacterium]
MSQNQTSNSSQNDSQREQSEIRSELQEFARLLEVCFGEIEY